MSDDFKSTFKKVDDEKCSNFLHKWMFLYKKYFTFEIKNESVVSLSNFLTRKSSYWGVNI